MTNALARVRAVVTDRPVVHIDERPGDGVGVGHVMAGVHRSRPHGDVVPPIYRAALTVPPRGHDRRDRASVVAAPTSGLTAAPCQSTDGWRCCLRAGSEGAWPGVGESSAGRTPSQRGRGWGVVGEVEFLRSGAGVFNRRALGQLAVRCVH